MVMQEQLIQEQLVQEQLVQEQLVVQDERLLEKDNDDVGERMELEEVLVSIKKQFIFLHTFLCN
jgi:hypothetical protein